MSTLEDTMRRMFKKRQCSIPNALALALLAISLVGFGSEAQAQTQSEERSRAVVALQNGHAGSVTSVVFSLDGRRIATGSKDDTARVWDVATGKLLRTLKGHAGDVASVAFSPDGRHIATGSWDNTARIWDAATGKLLRTLESHAASVTSVAFSPDGGHIATNGWHKTAGVWDVATGKLLRTFEGHAGSVTSVAFSPVGRRIVTGSGDKMARIWDTATGKLLRTLEGHAGSITSVVFSPDGSRISTGSSDDTARVWNAATGRLLRTLKGHAGDVASVAFSPDGRHIATGSSDKAVRVWDAATGKLLRTLEGHSDWVNSVAFSPDGRRVATGSDDTTDDETIRVWDAATGRLLRTLKGKPNVVASLALSPDGRHITTARNDKMVRVWDAATGRLLRTLKGHSSYIHSLAVSPDGRRIATGGVGGTARIWDAVTGKLLRSLRGHAGAVTSVAFSPDGGRIATSGWDKTARVWDAATGKLLRTLKGIFKGHSHWVTSVAFSPDGRRIATGSNDKTARVWDMATASSVWDAVTGKVWDAAMGKLLLTLEGHTGSVTSVAFSPDGRRIATGSSDDTARVWDAATGKLLRTLKGHSDWVTSVTFSPDGRRVATGSKDKTVRLWDSATGEFQRSVKGHADNVDSVVFSPDGRRMVTGSWDGTVRVWDPSTGELLATIIGGEGEWLVITPEGFYSASGKGSGMIAVVRGFEVFSIDQFYQALYRPDLVSEKLAGDPTGKVKEAAAKLDLDKIIASGGAPRVQILSPKGGSAVEDDELTVEAEITDQGGGIGRVEWRVNGVTLGVETKRGFSREPRRKVKGKSLLLSRKLRIAPGRNVIEVVAYNAGNLIASNPAGITLIRNAVASKSKPRLHVLAVAVDDYRDSRLRLSFAGSDAKALGTAFERAGKGLYETISITTVLDKEATVGGLTRVFKGLARTVRPDDVFIFFLAGHGKTIDGRYYFIPHDFRYEGVKSIVSSGIGQDKWQTWFSKIEARKSILLYDTCESGSLTGARIATRGMERIAALEKLTRAMGRTVISAATDDAPALEGYKGHGVFTYALLQALTQSDANKNKLIEVTELAGYVDAQVPKISHKAFGLRQIPQMNIVGSNFPLANRIVSIAPAGTTKPVISTKPTHVVIRPADLFPESGGAGAVTERLKPGAQVTLIKTEDGWTLVAKDGKRLGFVEASGLAPLH